MADANTPEAAPPGALQDLIRSHPSLADLDPAAIDALVAGAERVTFADGDDLMRQGEASDCAILTLDGTVAVVAQTEFGLVTLSELSGVQLLGDIGVYARLPRSATVVARAPTRALRIDSAAMMRLCHDNPEIPIRVIQQLGARLNAFNQAIATYADALSALDADHGDPGIVDSLLNPPPELTNFANAFRKMAQFITQQRQQREEMASASAIQTALLPFPLREDPGGRFRLDAVMKPARHVGGDFFDVLQTGPDHVVVTIGDVSGKGVPASLFATVCQMVMRLVLTNSENLGEALSRANDLIGSANREGMFATFFAARLDLRDGELRFCNAGHVWPVIQRADGSHAFLKEHDLPLAVLSDIAYAEHRANLTRGDRLILCTDGVLEAVNVQGEDFGQDRLIAALATVGAGPAAVSAAIVAAVDAFSEGAEQFDDIASLVIAYRP